LPPRNPLPKVAVVIDALKFNHNWEAVAILFFKNREGSFLLGGIGHCPGNYKPLFIADWLASALWPGDN
jgi:hypothetical protein